MRTDGRHRGPRDPRPSRPSTVARQAAARRAEIAAAAPPTPGLEEAIARETERKLRVHALGELHRVLHDQRTQLKARLNDESLPESIRTQGRSFIDNPLESFMWTIETMIRREQDGG